jgi:hypothetical protein
MMPTLSRKPIDDRRAANRGLSWPLWLLCGYLLFAHGCHGDEDHELFSALGPRLKAVGQRWTGPPTD